MTHRAMLCRSTLSALLATLTTAGAAMATEWLDPASAATGEEDDLLWYNILDLGLEGRGWDQADTETPYDRLPAKAKGRVRDAVWNLSLDSAGMCVRFLTDARRIDAHWVLRGSRLAMNHMAATGVSGLDLYVKREDGSWRWLAVGRPARQDNRTTLVNGLPEGEREYCLYLPLYNGVSTVEIGIPEGARIGRAPERPPMRRRPVLFYGTSITQGGCASRPGMVYTAILGRHLHVPVINLGFSGNGKMEPELADLLAELDPSVYVLDCLPNMGAEQVSERVVPFVERLRTSRPETPIVLVEDRSYTHSFLLPGPHERNVTSRQALREAHEHLLAKGVTGLHYVPGDHLLGDDGEGTVDGSHPTDLGFLRQAEALKPVLAPLLPESAP